MGARPDGGLLDAVQGVILSIPLSATAILNAGMLKHDSREGSPDSENVHVILYGDPSCMPCLTAMRTLDDGRKKGNVSLKEQGTIPVHLHKSAHHLLNGSFLERT